MIEINKIYTGNCMDIMKDIDDKSIDCVITSPPYWQLRDYGWSGQWGLEKTFQEYIEHLLGFMNEVWRVLKNEGTVWINLGDTYNSNIKGNRNGIDNTTWYNAKRERIRSEKIGTNWQIEKNDIAEKCLLLIPHRFAIGCIERGWIVRNDIIWAKRNGMPESVTDRFTKKHEYFFFMVKEEKYYFDLDSIRDKHKDASIQRYNYAYNGNPDGLDREWSGRPKSKRAGTKYADGGRINWTGDKSTEGHELGKNPGGVSDFWDIPTNPSIDAHYASYNTKLIDKPIIAGCPKGGIILDPFCGTATTGCRAIDLGRKFIGIEGSEKYVKIANKKLHKYLVSQQLF